MTDHQPPGIAPTAVGAVAMDWSGSPVEAVVGQLIETLGGVDRQVARAVDLLIRAMDTSATEHVLGVAPELLLSQTCRAVAPERKVLLQAATTLVRMPGVRQAFVEGWVSWSQVRTIVTLVRPLDADGRDQVDTLVSRLAHTYVDMEADPVSSSAPGEG